MTLRYRILRLLGFKTAEEAIANMRAGKGGIGPKERRQFAALERASLPLFLKLPRSGEVYTAKTDAMVDSRVYFMAPFTGGGPINIPKDTKVIISENDNWRSTTIYFLPADKTMEDVFVIEKYRNDPAYNGYSLSTDPMNFFSKFELDQES